MSDNSGIQWTEATWNPVSGCSKVSPGCKHCYAEHDWNRLSKNPKSPYFGRAFTDVKVHPERLDQPLRWTKPRKIFVNSMSDLFHEDVPAEFIDQIVAVMALAPRHTFQILTKRAELMRHYMEDCWRVLGRQSEIRSHVENIAWRINVTGTDLAQAKLVVSGTAAVGREPLPNVHLGVSVESREQYSRINQLHHTPAAVKFLSLEPLLEAMPDIYSMLMDYPSRIGWVIVGGESGPNARPCNVEWIREIVAQCRIARVPVFVKQLGSLPSRPCPSDCTIGLDRGRCKHSHKFDLRDRKGGDPAEWPEDLRVREFPR